MKNLRKNWGYSLIELLTVIGILTALSAVALVQYGKYKQEAERTTKKAQEDWEKANCLDPISQADRKQCLCKKGLGELVGLNSDGLESDGSNPDCCPFGQKRDSTKNCVTL